MVEIVAVDGKIMETRNVDVRVDKDVTATMEGDQVVRLQWNEGGVSVPVNPKTSLVWKLPTDSDSQPRPYTSFITCTLCCACALCFVLLLYISGIYSKYPSDPPHCRSSGSRRW